MNNNISLIQVHTGRKQLYYFLARVFLDVPDNDLYTYTLNILPAFEILSKHNKALESGYIELSNFLQKRINLQGENLKLFDNGMLSDYSNLFCRQDGLSLYQSSYTAPYSENLKENLYSLQKQYGFDIGQDNINLSDHISYELSFLGYLSGLTAYNIQKENHEMVSHLIETQINFLENYMLNWVEHFMNEVQNMPEGALFYYPVSSIVNGFLEYDHVFIKKQLPE